MDLLLRGCFHHQSSLFNRLNLLRFNRNSFSCSDYGSSCSDWSSLPAHLLDSVVEKLLLPDDYLRFGSVCTSWRSVAQDNKAKRVRTTAPMLLFYTGKKSTWGLYDVTENKVLPMQVRIPNHRYCGSSSTGWLVSIDKYFQVTLVNPFLRVKGSRKNDNSIIHLPPLKEASFVNPFIYLKKNRIGGFLFDKALISADPLVSPNDCVVVVIWGYYQELAYVRVGVDWEWNYVEHGELETQTSGPMIEDIVYIEDKFYALDRWGNVRSFRATGQYISEVEVVANRLDQNVACYFKYIVKVNEKDLLMVHRYTVGERPLRHYKRRTVGFKLFKLNYEKCEWFQIDDLGEFALFVGDNSSVSVLGLEWSGCQPNCIYFTHGWDRVCIDGMQDGHHDFGVYEVKSRTFSQTCGTVAKTLTRVMKRPPLWVMPPALKL